MTLFKLLFSVSLDSTNSAGLARRRCSPGDRMGVRILSHAQAGWNCCDEYSPGNFVCSSSEGGNSYVGGSEEASRYEQKYCPGN